MLFTWGSFQTAEADGAGVAGAADQHLNKDLRCDAGVASQGTTP